MRNPTNKFRCDDCGPIYSSHFNKWSEDLFSFLFPIKVSQRKIDLLSRYLDKILIMLKVFEASEDLENKKIFFRAKVFIEEALKEGIKVKALKSKWGFNNRFYLENNGKIFPFEGIPRAEFLNDRKADRMDDKAFVKKVLDENGIPVAKGRSFWFWQKRKAISWGINQIGYPLIVKPRTGSMSQHVTFDINSRAELQKAVKKALRYSPTFVIEKFLSDMNVYRATVVDEKNVAVVQRIPAHVIGDGIKNIRELIDEKNQNPERGAACSEDCTTFKLIYNQTSEELLKKRGQNLESIPKKGEKVFIQEKVILDIGADLEEVTNMTHPDNKKLFCDIAKIFELKLAGIDFLAQDISRSWKEQECAVPELNSMPFVDMHHHPTYGEPVNVGGWLVEMVKKYYN